METGSRGPERPERGAHSQPDGATAPAHEGRPGRVPRHSFSRDADPHLWRVNERDWRRNRQDAERLTVTRVVERLEVQRQEASLARTLCKGAAVRSAQQRQADPGEWKTGERRWRQHCAEVESSVQARAMERTLLDQQKRLDAGLARMRAKSELLERRREEREAIRRHKALMEQTAQAGCDALAKERRDQMAAFRAREKQRLATFELNVQRKRLGLPRLEPEADQAQQPGWDAFGLSRVRPDTLSLVAAVGGLTLELKPAARKAAGNRPISAGPPRLTQGARPKSPARIQAS